MGTTALDHFPFFYARSQGGFVTGQADGVSRHDQQ